MGSKTDFNFAMVLVVFVLSMFGAPSVSAKCHFGHSEEVKGIYDANQNDLKIRPRDHREWVAYAKRLSDRIDQLKRIQRAAGMCSSDDYLLAGNVVAHGLTISDNLTAIQYASTAKSLSPDALEPKRLFAVVMDELLIRMDTKQIYGTQYDVSGGKVTRLPQMIGAVPEEEIKAVKIDSPEQSPLAK